MLFRLRPSLDPTLWRRLALVLTTSTALVVLATSVGCGEEESIRPYRRRRTKSTVKTTDVDAKSFLFNAEDFDLATVVGMVKENTVKDAEALEAAINKDDSALSNVDIDKDDIIDYVMVKEGRDGEAITLDFKAVPSSTNKEDDAETIANMKFVRNESSKEVEVSGGYPEYAQGYNDHHYGYRHRGPSMGTALFMTWLLMPSRPYYYRGYYAPYYMRRPLYSRSMMTSRRTAYRTTRSVSPMSRTSRPANYNIKSASKGSSKFASGKSSVAKAKSSSLSSRKGSMKSFGSRSSTKTKKSASGFGSAKSKSSGKGFGGSKSSGSRSGGFGKSSGSRSGSRSSGASSSSGSRSRSFGSSSGSRGSSGSRSRSSGGSRRR